MTQTPQSNPPRKPQGRAPSHARAAAGLARGLTVLALIVGGMGLAFACVCLITAPDDAQGGRLLAAGGFFLGGLAGGAILWGAGQLAGKMAWVSLEMGEVSRRLEARGPAGAAPAAAPAAAPPRELETPAPPPGGNQAVLEAIEQLRSEVLLTDEQRREKAAHAATARIDDIARLVEEELADGRLDAAEEKLLQLAAAGAGEEQTGPLRAKLVAGLVRQAEESIVGGQLEHARRCMEQIARHAPGHEQLSALQDRVLTFFAERADRAILTGDFRRAEDWIEELVQAGPDNLRIVELRSRMQHAQAGVVASEFAKQKKHVEDMLAVADYDRAEAAADDMIQRLGVTDEVKAFVDMVKGEAAAFRDEQRRRMLGEVRQYAEARQWRKALDAARELVAEHPRSRQAEEIRGMMLLMEENARIEEVRELRDRIADLIERKRFAEAVDVAEDVMHRFPDTQVAGQLAREIDKLRKAAGINDLL